MKHVTLVGPMGAGKTAIGRQLARLLDLPFEDTDLVIQQRTGVDIPFIFEKEGEAGFRARESRVLQDLLAGPACVIATGGGIVEREENRSLLKEHHPVFLLDASIDSQLARTRRGLHRPLLEANDPRAVLESLYLRRRPLYLEVASQVVVTDNRHVKAVAGEVLELLRKETPQA
ncbi:MAG: shikimate kinase [Gammaproteobacteria bacterium]|nr:shikimate kinase [Gammaproteobacteria bacterium]